MPPGVRTPFHRVRVVITATSRVDLHPDQAGLLYAVIAAAHGRTRGSADVLPDGLMLDAPERCRVVLAPGDRYAFGFTVVADDPAVAAATIRGIVLGLRHLGANRPQRPVALGGNFRVVEVRDLVDRNPLGDQWNATAVPRRHIEAEADRATELTELTLRFTSPLRMTRGKKRMTGTRHETFFDPTFFDAGLFTLRVLKRLHELGLWAPPHETDREAHRAVVTEENRLVWIDLAYGARHDGSRIYGAVGRVRIRCSRPDLAAALAWGQYARVGQATRFGQGAYRIDELGPDPFACERELSLIHPSLAEIDLDEAAERYDLPAGSLRRAAAELRRGRYSAGEVFRLPIVQSDGRTRTLAIPTKLDRALQRAVITKLGPALDRLFEESSVAYRRGLGRETAAKRVRDAFDAGFRYGLRADFRRFFDSIDHRLLEDRLEAYLGDPAMAELLMSWVRAGSPTPDRGVPTGAPISPLLSNLFLDQFDEEVASEDARLIRYADDFVILYRTKQEADRVFEAATSAAKALELVLNEKKTHAVDLGNGFEFLGYRFDKRDRWVATATGVPQPIGDIGWRQASKPAPTTAWALLPGEEATTIADDRSWVVVGPGLNQVRVASDRLECSYGDGRETAVSLERMHELIVLGRPTIAAGALSHLLREGIRTLVADDNGRIVGSISRDDSTESPEGVAAQVDLARDERWRLGLARVLIAAKIANYAALADVERGRDDDKTVGPALRDLSSKALLAPSVETLLGIEGSAAARWYRGMAMRLPDWCRFERRVAPDAEDPGNVMLNIAMTALHRQLVLSIRHAGLVPTIGIFHEPRAGHATLASDLQEPFRHLMDRAVLHAARSMKPTDFRPDRDGEYALRIEPGAARRLIAAIHETFAQTCAPAGERDACTYRTHVLVAARSLKRHLLDRSQTLRVFRHWIP